MGTWSDAIKFIHLNRLDGFNIKSGTGENAWVFRFDDNESIDQNITRAENIMAFTPGTYFTLIGWCGKNQSRNSFQYQFANSPQQQNVTVNNAVGGIDENTLNERIENAVERVRAEYDKRDLEKRENELKEAKRLFEQDKASVVGVIINKLGPMLRNIPQIGTLTAGEQPNQQITVSQAAQTDDDNDNQQEIEVDIPDNVVELIVRWRAVEPDYEKILTKIVELAESNDNKYNIAKGLI